MIEVKHVSGVVAAAVAAAVLSSACSEAQPTEEDGRAFLETVIESMQPNTTFSIEAFEKTNGMRLSPGGLPGYQLDYRAIVHWPAGYRTECFGQTSCFGYNLFDPFALPRRSGARITVTGSLFFVETERGWRRESRSDTREE